MRVLLSFLASRYVSPNGPTLFTKNGRQSYGVLAALLYLRSSTYYSLQMLWEKILWTTTIVLESQAPDHAEPPANLAHYHPPLDHADSPLLATWSIINVRGCPCRRGGLVCMAYRYSRARA